MKAGMQIPGVQLVGTPAGQGELPVPGTGRQATAASGMTVKSTFDRILSGYRELPDREAIPELAWVRTQEDRLRWAATELEAVMLRDLLNAVLPPGKGSFWGNGPGVAVYSSLFLDEMARELARSGQFGIADVLVGQLRLQEKPSTATYEGRPESGQPSRGAPLPR